ncbi:baseplate J/gp47 family protein [Pseudomonas sp.]|uniref:baseplate J/gp47 family protein n=1 Tax=Pseudomonas sp. TaxID=306 RepID=UPI00258794A0|nr:baseplate J/gp47 family protein [Pseudomonas sp.]
MFQIKDFVSITASMLNHIRGTTTKITDLQPGSVSRTLVEAPAVEIEELYLQIFNGLREAIPVATFKSFGFDKLAAAYARGFVSVSNATAPDVSFTTPAGTSFTTSDGRAYLSTQEVIWPAGQNAIRIPVIAESAGLAYNVSAGSIVSSSAFDDSYTISNSAINNGRDVETDAEREARFASFIGSLSRGTTFACLSAAESATVTDEQGNIQEYVTRIGYTEIAGYVKIFIYSSAGLPSSALIMGAQKIIDGWEDTSTGVITPGYRAGGVNVEIASMTEREIDLTARVTMQTGYELDETVTQAITDEFSTLLASINPGEVLYIESIENSLLSVIGVKSVLISATENITCEANEALVPGAVTVTAL